MKFLRVFTLLLLLFAVHPFAKHIAVLETGADSKDLVSDSDRQYLTNVFREQAVRILPAELNYTIMTRENISAMLPPGKAIEDCEGSCLAETGRNISADYVCQARIGSFGGDLTLSAELYETAENKLLASFNGRGKNVNELLDIIVKNSPDFFAKIKGLKGNYADLNELASNLGILVLKPVMENSAGSEYPLNILVDGKKEEKTIIELEPGVHEV